MQALDSTGAALWAGDGVQVLSNDRDHYQPTIIDSGNDVIWVAASARLGSSYRLELARLDLLTGSMLWDNYTVLNGSNAEIIDLELAPAHDHGAYIGLLQDPDTGLDGNTQLTLRRIAPDGVWRTGSHVETGDGFRLNLGEVNPGTLAVCWSDFAAGEIVSAGFDFRLETLDLGGVVPLWGPAQIGGLSGWSPLHSTTVTGRGMFSTWDDASYPYAAFVDITGLMGHKYPHISALADVPGDQGGWLTLTWDASSLEGDYNLPIEQYSLWLRPGGFDPVKAAVPSAETAAAVSAETGLDIAQTKALLAAGWSYLSVVPAWQQAAYSALVPSLSDVSTAGTPHTRYMVMAHSIQPWTIYKSEPAVGISVDNLAPGVPAGLSGANTGGQVALQWNILPDAAHDLAGYVIYASDMSGFSPSVANRLGVSATPAFTESAVAATRYYVATGRDVHGNESAPSSELAVSGAVSGVDEVPGAYHLSSVHPNPFNPSTTFEFSLPTGSWVDVDVVDVRGQRVRTLMSERLAGGQYQVRWNGRDDSGRKAASGVYLARVRSQFGSLTAKMTLTK